MISGGRFLASVCLCAGIAGGSVDATAGFDSTRPVLVVGPTADGARLEVFDRGGRLCGRVRTPRIGWDQPSCGRPSGALRAPFIGGQSYGQGGEFTIWGVVASEVTSVEVVLSGGRRVEVATLDGADYAGRYAGVGRFFLAAAGPKPGRGLARPVYLRLLASNGELLAVEDLYESRPLGPTVTLGHERAGKTRWRVTARAERRLQPVPGDEERFVRSVCVGISSSSGGSATCAELGQADFFHPTFSQECDAAATYVLALLPPRTDAFAVLGNGRRMRLREYRLPRRLGGGPATAEVFGPRAAIRRIELVDLAGRPLQAVRAGLAPARLTCVDFDGSSILGVFDLDEPRRTPPGAQPALQVEDRDERLCVSLAGTPTTSAECGPPPLEIYDSNLLTLRLPDVTFVGGVVPAEVTQLRLELAGGGTQVVQSATTGPYQGRWAGRVAFFMALVPGHPAVTAVRMRDSQGRLIGTVPGPDRPPFEIAPTPLLGVKGGPRLVAGIVARSTQGPRSLCLSLLPRTSGWGGCTATYGHRSVQITATCRPRAITFWGYVPAGTRALAVQTTRRVVQAKLRALPARFKVEGKLALLRLPANEKPLRGILVGPEGRATRRPVPLPAARRQCGYDGQLWLGGLR